MQGASVKTSYMASLRNPDAKYGNDINTKHKINRYGRKNQTIGVRIKFIKE
jgi:hypothetical protein